MSRKQPMSAGFPAAVVWDLDGTLIDSAADIARSLNRLFAELGLAPLGLDRVRGLIGEGVATLIERALAVAGKPRGELPAGRDLVARFLSLYSEDAGRSTRLYPGAREALQKLGGSGVRHAICTNKPEQITRKILSDLDVGRHFETVIGGDTLARRKPDPLPLKAALAGLDVPSSEALMIGDSAIDVATARAAGVMIGVVSFGYARLPVGELGADFVIDDLAALPARIAALQGPVRRIVTAGG
jgi:phosphoglycolate phosphatase